MSFVLDAGKVAAVPAQMQLPRPTGRAANASASVDEISRNPIDLVNPGKDFQLVPQETVVGPVVRHQKANVIRSRSSLNIRPARHKGSRDVWADSHRSHSSLLFANQPGCRQPGVEHRHRPGARLACVWQAFEKVPHASGKILPTPSVIH